MNILFVQDNGLNESLPICEISGCLKARGHRTALLLTRNPKFFYAKHAGFKPDLIVLSVPMWGDAWAAQQIGPLREQYGSKAPVALVGIHPTYYPNALTATGADVLIRGEADVPLLEWIDGGLRPDYTTSGFLRRGEDPEASVIGSRLIDPNGLPLPDRGIYYDTYPFLGRCGWKKFISGRGCVFDCTFCYSPSIKEAGGGVGPYLRRKRPERVVQEIEAVRARWPLETVHFIDDLFTHDRSWLREFLPLYRDRLHIPFSCNAIGAQFDDELPAMMADAGAYLVSLGVETANEELRMKTLRKPVSNEQLLAVADGLRRKGVQLVTFNIVGWPGESVPEAMKTVEFSRDLHAHFVRFNTLQLMPYSQMARDAARDGHIPESALRDSAGWQAFVQEREKAGSHVHLPTDDDNSITNIAFLHQWLYHYPSWRRALLWLARRRHNGLHRAALQLSLLVWRFGFRISLRDGLRLLRHCGSPRNFTKFFPALP